MFVHAMKALQQRNVRQSVAATRLCAKHEQSAGNQATMRINSTNQYFAGFLQPCAK
jgi:hypothetical protein